MNKIKSAIADLRAYLGRDTRGVALLDDATRLVNELRKSNSETNTKLRDATSAANVARERERALAGRMEELTRRLEREQSLRRQAEAGQLSERNRADALAIRMDSLLEIQSGECSCGHDEPPVQLLEERGFRLNFLEMMQDVPVCPRSQSVPASRKDRFNFEFDLQQIIDSWSYADMATLGRVVACISMFSGVCTVAARSNFRSAGELSLSSGTSKRIFKWLGKHYIDNDPRLGFLR